MMMKIVLIRPSTDRDCVGISDFGWTAAQQVRVFSPRHIEAAERKREIGNKTKCLLLRHSEGHFIRRFYYMLTDF